MQTTPEEKPKFRALSYVEDQDGGVDKERVVVNCELVVLGGTCYNRGGIILLENTIDTALDEADLLGDLLDDILAGDHEVDIQYSGGIDLDEGHIYSTNANRRWQSQSARAQAEQDRRNKECRIKIYGPWPEDLPEKPIHRALVYTDAKNGHGNNTHVRVNCEMVFLKGKEYLRDAEIPWAVLGCTSLAEHGMLDDILDGDGMGLTPSAVIDFDTGDTFKTNGRAKWQALRVFDREQDSGATPMELSYKYTRAY